MVVHRVQVKDKARLHALILEKYGHVKWFLNECGMSESTIWRIIKTGKVSYYGASKLAQTLQVDWSELFELITVEADDESD